jgi:hypothetical protein
MEQLDQELRLFTGGISSSVAILPSLSGTALIA